MDSEAQRRWAQYGLLRVDDTDNSSGHWPRGCGGGLVLLPLAGLLRHLPPPLPLLPARSLLACVICEEHYVNGLYANLSSLPVHRLHL